MLRLGMKSAALRGAIAESRLQDHHRPDRLVRIGIMAAGNASVTSGMTCTRTVPLRCAATATTFSSNAMALGLTGKLNCAYHLKGVAYRVV